MSTTEDIYRGITVGKSWPRPATPSTLMPRWEGEFRDHADWVNFASKRLTVAYDSNGAQLKAICVDTLGRLCANGRDMQRAEDEGAFPVRYFWDCEPAPTVVEAAPDLLAALKSAEESLSDMLDGAIPMHPARQSLKDVRAAIAKAEGRS